MTHWNGYSPEKPAAKPPAQGVWDRPPSGGLLTSFVMVGSGPTRAGRQAGDIVELVYHGMEKDLHHFHPDSDRELIGQNIGP